MSRSKKLFVLFVVIWIVVIMFLMYDFSKKSKAPWIKSNPNNEISINLTH